MEHDLSVRVGAAVRAARTARHLSLSALAAGADIGKGTLSELENGTRNPTLATLYALAGTLGVPLAHLLGGETGVTVTDGGTRSTLLATSVVAGTGATVETYTFQMVSGGVRTSPAHGPGVVEHLYVVAGRARVVRVGPDGETAHEAGPGHAATWVSDVPHRYEAVGDQDLDGVLVITTPARPVAAARP